MKFKDLPYERVDFEAAGKELDALIADFKNAASGEEAFAVHERYYKLIGRISTLYTIANIRFDIDTADKFYEAEVEYYDEQYPAFDSKTLLYKEAMLESPFREYLTEKIGEVAFTNLEIAKKAMDEKLVPLKQEENNLVTEYTKLIASAKIEFDGKELNISLLRPYLISSDRSVRKAAWAKLSAFFSDNREKLDEIYDKLVKNRTAQAREMGYENFVELGYYRMGRNCYGKEEVESFRKQVKEYFVPFAE